VGYKAPKEITKTAIETGATKAALRPDKMLVSGFLAGAYIAFAGLVAIATTSGLDPKTWGTLPTLFFGATFATGLVLVVVAGSELLTGNMALVPMAAMRGRVPVPKIGFNWALVAVGNLLGSLFVAYFLAVQTGVLTAEPDLTRLAGIAAKKGTEETEWQIFLRAVGCNWLVCLAVWMALSAEDVAGKILAIFFPIMAFVAIGFDHVVANMFFIPAAIFAHVPDITWWDAIHNWIFAFLGNAVGGAIFVGGSYYYLYGRGADSPGDTPEGANGRNGRGATEDAGVGSLAQRR
jgi:formate transporter